MFKMALMGLFLIAMGGGSIYLALKGKKPDDVNASNLSRRVGKGAFAIKNLFLPAILVILGLLMVYGAIFIPVK